MKNRFLINKQAYGARQRLMGITVGALCAVLTACQPSDGKVTEAKEKYAQLAEAHNQVVEAHGKIADNSLDDELTALRDRANEMGNYNLAEMKDEEIDQMIGTMDSLIAEYEEYLTLLSDIKREEEAAVVTSITLSLTNRTDFSFSEIALFEEGESGGRENLLGDMQTLMPGQSLMGLVVQRDMENTPWTLVLADESGREFEIELSVGEFSQDGVVSLSLSYDGEQDKILIS